MYSCIFQNEDSPKIEGDDIHELMNKVSDYYEPMGIMNAKGEWVALYLGDMGWIWYH
jgi:hypothetical protein